jgi:hypothetical protein
MQIGMKSAAVVLAILLILIVAAAIFTQSDPISWAQTNRDVVILSYTIYQVYGFAPFSEGKGDYQVSGEVKNNAAEALHFNITANFYDANNKIIATKYLTDSYTETPPSFLHVLLPGRKSPFSIYLSRWNEAGYFQLVDHCTLEVTSSPADTYRSGVEIVSQTSHETDGSLYIEGEVKNIGPYYIDGIMVFGTFYNETGDVVAVASEGGGYIGPQPSQTETGLPPNYTTTFLLKVDGYEGRLEKIDRYELTTEGYDYSLWASDGQLINPEIVYSQGVVQEQTAEPEEANGSPLILYATIAAITAFILIATFLMLRKRRARNLAP